MKKKKVKASSGMKSYKREPSMVNIKFSEAAAAQENRELKVYAKEGFPKKGDIPSEEEDEESEPEVSESAETPRIDVKTDIVLNEQQKNPSM